MSPYEPVFKARRRRLDAAMLHVVDATRTAGFRLCPPSARDWTAAAVRDWTHGDPFDRLLLAQAENGDMVLVSKNVVFDGVSGARVW